MRRRALLLSFVALLLTPVDARALPTASPEEVGLSRERLARIGQALNGQIEAKSFPGAAALIARKGRVAYFETFGQLDPKTGAPMSKDAIFRLYSMTKPFTSVAAMMLVEDGRLRLTDPVGTYLPELAKLDVVGQGTDSNGKPTYTMDTTFYLPAEKVKRLSQPLATDRATGKPIVLHDVTVPPKNDAGGAGAASTTLDYARFLQMLANGGQLEGKRLLAGTTVRHMTSDHLGDIKPAIPLLAPGYGFGLGFAVRRADGLNGVAGTAGEYNWGGAGGTAFWVDPKEQLVAVLMTQAQPGPWQREFRELFRQLVYQAIID